MTTTEQMIARAGTLARLSRFIEAPRTQRAIVAVIIVNALVMGLETSPTVMESVGDLLIALDRAALAIFVVEIAAKLLVYRWSFFRGAWNVFDFLVVGVALVPAGQSLSVLRALRVLRVLRLVSMIPKMRLVVQALLGAIPAMGSVIALLALVYYVCAVMATKLFGPAFDAWFGTVGRSLYSLFQIMTLESWSMGIVRPVLEVYPYAWVFFVAFILVTSFAVLNLFIAIIVNSMHDAAQADLESRAPDTRALIEEIRALRREVEALRDERR